jgi:hypothetical protein
VTFDQVTSMSQLIQIVYCSRSTFPAVAQADGVEPEVGRILMQSRRNNPKSDLVGALYYGDGYFFQCLEGEEGAVETLYARLLDDPRHTDVRLMRRQTIAQRGFERWSMKYVPTASDVQALLARNGLRSFDPNRFSDRMIDDMVGLLQAGSEATQTARPSPTPVLAASPRSASGGLASAAFGLAALALVVAVVALVRTF